MRKVRYMLMYMTVVSITSTAKIPQSYIILAASESKESLVEQADKFEKSIEMNSVLNNLLVKNDMQKHIVEQGNIHVLKVGPFNGGNPLALGYLELRNDFPLAFIMEDLTPILNKTPKVKYIEKEDQSIWMALFGLGTLGILALFFSSTQIKRLRREHHKIQKKQKEIEQKQSGLLEKMGEKIQSAALDNVKSETKLLETPLEVVNEKEIQKQIRTLKNNDEDLLRTTYEMIDFLKIKSGNIIIRQEAFQLSNMLHKLTNAIAPVLRSTEYKLYYDIENDVTRYLIGDTNRIFQVLHNLLLDILDRQTSGEIRVNVQIKKDEDLVFLIQNRTLFLSNREIENLFIPRSWEEVHHQHKEFGFFVLNELIENMGGKLHIESDKNKGTQYALVLPFIRDLDNKSRKKELSKVLASKKALVIDDDVHAATILTEILHDFEIDVLFKSSENLKLHRPNLEGIDFVIVKSTDINEKVLHFFRNLDMIHVPDIIVIQNVYDEYKELEKVSLISDAVLYSPLIVGDVEEALKQLYIKKTRRKKDIREDGLKDFRIVDSRKVDISDFEKFKDKTILIVEDNFVSQQVMSSILGASQLRILNAENGQEALDILDGDITVDLIFMDIDIPIINGFDVTRAIRKNNRYKKVPIVAVTGLGFNNEVEQMLFSGMNACIIKPHRFGQLYTALERFLDPSSFKSASVEKRMQIQNLNKMILDVEKGLSYVRSETFYSEIVAQVLLALRNSNTLVTDMIHKDQIKELRAFCVDALGLSATIGATGYAALLKEMLIEMREKDIFLSRYIPEYKLRWLELENEMKRYLKQ